MTNDKSCYSDLNVDYRHNCREPWLTAYECGATDDEKTCDADSESQLDKMCGATFSAYAT